MTLFVAAAARARKNWNSSGFVELVARARQTDSAFACSLALLAGWLRISGKGAFQLVYACRKFWTTLPQDWLINIPFYCDVQRVQMKMVSKM